MRAVRAFGFHFDLHPSTTQEHLLAPKRGVFQRKWLFRSRWVLLDADVGGLKFRVAVVRFRPWSPSEQSPMCPNGQIFQTKKLQQRGWMAPASNISVRCSPDQHGSLCTVGTVVLRARTGPRWPS